MPMICVYRKELCVGDTAETKSTHDISLTHINDSVSRDEKE